MNKIKNNIQKIVCIIVIVLGIATIFIKSVQYSQETHEVKIAEYPFEIKRISDNLTYLIDKQNGVMYMQLISGYGNILGFSVMLNPDGTPKIWEGYE